MKRCFCLLAIALLLLSLAQAQIESPWLENATNPIFGQGRGGPKAYYPTVLYDEAEFSGHGVAAPYKMWYGTDNSRVGIAYSQDGLVWQDGGLIADNVFYHCKVLYNATGFDNSTYCYRMWYYDVTVGPYTYQAIRIAESEDGVN